MCIIRVQVRLPRTPILSCPLEHEQMPITAAHHKDIHFLEPTATRAHVHTVQHQRTPAHPTHIHFLVPIEAHANAHSLLPLSKISSSKKQPISRAHRNTSKCPFPAAEEQMLLFQGHPFSRAHCNTSKCPYLAAPWETNASHGHPFSRAHWRTFKCPFSAAFEQTRSFHGDPFSRAHPLVAKLLAQIFF